MVNNSGTQGRQLLDSLIDTVGRNLRISYPETLLKISPLLEQCGITLHLDESKFGGDCEDWVLYTLGILKYGKNFYGLMKSGYLLKSDDLGHNTLVAYYSEKFLGNQKSSRLDYFHFGVCKIEEGKHGPVYGKQWRDFSGIDQIRWVEKEIKNNPNSRRLIVSAWNPAEIEEMSKAGLPPCHTLFQFYVTNGRLSCQLYQRSADVFLGVPFNIASYALLTMMISHVCDLKPGDFVHTFGDAHLYLNHIEQAKLQLTREPKKLPAMKINPEVKSIFDFRFDDFMLEGYEPHPPIKAPISV